MDPLCSKRREHNSGGASCSNGLTDYVLFEILIRLPADSAHRFKCVSKHWFSLISSHYFAHQYNLRRPDCLISRHSLIFHHSAGRKDRYGLIEVASTGPAFKSLQSSYRTFLPVQPQDLRYFQLLGSSNGLVLCSAHLKKTEKSLDYCYYVCNPLTRHCIVLPPPPEHDMKYPHVVGFLCDSTNGITCFHVVIVLIPPGHSPIFKIKIFSCKNGDWSEFNVPSPRGFQWNCMTRDHDGIRRSLLLELSPPVLQSAFSGKVVFCNRNLHWYGNRGVVAYDPFNSPSQSIFISMPEDFNDFLRVWIAECRGHIRVCTFFSELVIWELEDPNTSKWCRKFLLVNFFCRFKELYPPLRILNLTNIAFSEIDGNIVYLFYEKQVAEFNLETERLERQEFVFPTPSNCNHYDDRVFPFVLPWWPTPVPGFNPQGLMKR